MTGRGAARSIALPVLLAAGALALGLAGAPAASAADVVGGDVADD